MSKGKEDRKCDVTVKGGAKVLFFQGFHFSIVETPVFWWCSQQENEISRATWLISKHLVTCNVYYVKSYPLQRRRLSCDNSSKTTKKVTKFENLKSMAYAEPKDPLQVWQRFRRP
jgi:hypothetical protein